MSEIFLPAFVTLFVIVDPLGLMPVFAVATSGGDSLHRRSMALRGIGIATLVLLLFGLVGERILDIFGITLAAFRIAGGMLLFATALEMIFEFRAKRRSHTAEAASHAPAPEDISVFPFWPGRAPSRRSFCSPRPTAATGLPQLWSLRRCCW